MSTTIFQKCVRLGGVMFFCAALAAAIFFAEGYWYDAGAHDFVKQGLVFFEDVQPAGVRLYADGEELAWGGSGELRLSPGVHHLVFASEGYWPWEKRVQVPEDEVLRFEAIRLFPASEAVPSVFTRKVLSPVAETDEIFAVPDGLYLKNSRMHFWKAFEFDGSGNFTIHEDELPLAGAFPLGVFNRPRGNFSWEFRVGKSFHGLFFDGDLQARFCDLDRGNCHALGTFDVPILFASSDRTKFFGIQGGHLVMFDFGNGAEFPRELFHRGLQKMFGVAAVLVGVAP